MKIIVTGATGFVGSNLVPEFVARGHEVIALARTVPDTELPGVSWIRGDLASRQWDPESGLPPAVDAVVHLAQSKSYRDFPDAAPDIFDVNIAATFKLLDYARRAGASHFIYASSGSVYTGLDEPLLSEELPISPSNFSDHPLGFYCATKLCGEALVESFRPEFPSVASLRIFAPYGPGGDASLVNRLAARVAAGEEIQVQGKPGLTLNPIHVDDVIRVHCRLLESGDSVGLLNVAGEEVISLTDVVKIAARVSEASGAIDYVPADPPEGNSLIADIGRLKEKLFFTPRMTIEEGIRSLIAS